MSSDQHSVPMSDANMFGLALGSFGVAALVGWHWAAWGWEGVRAAAAAFFGKPLVLLPAAAAGLAVHEAVHGLVWGWLGRVGWESIRFCFDRRTFTPFVHCRAPLRASAYRAGAAAPGLLVGVLPAAAGTLFGWGGVAAFGWLMTFIAGGDALVLLLLRGVDGRTLVEDHPDRAGCIVRASAEPSASTEPTRDIGTGSS